MEFLSLLDRTPRPGVPASSLRCGKFQPHPCRDMHHQIWHGPRVTEKSLTARHFPRPLRRWGNDTMPQSSYDCQAPARRCAGTPAKGYSVTPRSGSVQSPLSCDIFCGQICSLSYPFSLYPQWLHWKVVLGLYFWHSGHAQSLFSSPDSVSVAFVKISLISLLTLLFDAVIIRYFCHIINKDSPPIYAGRGGRRTIWGNESAIGFYHTVIVFYYYSHLLWFIGP